ncbi:MAG: BON domain-containing protein [Xanthomonadales bacterium]|nr:BON domain-containing protein [Xanthomonadales bacterium]
MNPNQRHRRKPRAALCLAVLLLAAIISACTPSAQRRTFGTVIDDQAAEVGIVDTLYSRPEFDENDHIKAEAHNETLLLAGEVSSQEKKALAGQVAAQWKSIERVVNQLEVMPAASTSSRMHNSYITAKINSKLTASNPLEGFDAGRIKVITAHGTVYLMGSVTRAEGDAVAEIARSTGGVDKVVKVFDYTD